MATERIQRRIDSLLDEADEAITSLDWQVVRARAQAVLGLQPGNSDALSYLSAAYRNIEGDGAASTTETASEMWEFCV